MKYGSITGGMSAEELTCIDVEEIIGLRGEQCNNIANTNINFHGLDSDDESDDDFSEDDDGVRAVGPNELEGTVLGMVGNEPSNSNNTESKEWRVIRRHLQAAMAQRQLFQMSRSGRSSNSNGSCHTSTATMSAVSTVGKTFSSRFLERSS